MDRGNPRRDDQVEGSSMDLCSISARAFDHLADAYLEKYGALTDYDEFYDRFCGLLPSGPVRVLDAACGPGNVARRLRSRRPEISLLGIDLAPRMLELARAAVPTAEFRLHDCRRLGELGGGFDGIVCAFGLPYLSAEEVAAFIPAAAGQLKPGGLLYLSTMLAEPAESGFHEYRNGQRVHVTYHTEETVNRALESGDFGVVFRTHLASPPTASKATNDLVIIARRATAPTV